MLLNNILTQQTKEHFDLLIDSYYKSSFFYKEIGKRLLSRVEFLNYKPKNILDLGSGCGFMLPCLSKRFQPDTLLALDLSYNLLSQIVLEDKQKILAINSNAYYLPFASNSLDFIFSTATLPFLSKPGLLFAELYRVLKPGSPLLFNTFGPSTLATLSKSEIFLDMHDIGDVLEASGFNDVVVDREDLVIEYDNVTRMLNELKEMGLSLFLDLDFSVSENKLFFEIVSCLAFVPSTKKEIQQKSGKRLNVAVLTS